MKTQAISAISILFGSWFTTGCSLAPAKHIYTEIEIAAPTKTVWAILADNNRYPQWNPYHVSVQGVMKEGEKLNVTLHKPNGEVVHIDPHVIRIIPLQELTWGGGIKGIFHGEHTFLLEEIRPGHTKLVQKESFTGFAIPFASLESIEEGYSLMNQALKERAESFETSLTIGPHPNIGS
jgi:hypothetical protein